LQSAGRDSLTTVGRWVWFPAGGYRIRRTHISSPFASEDKRLPAAKPDCFFMPVPNIGVEAFHIGLESFPGFRTFAAQTKKTAFRPCLYDLAKY